MWWTKKNDNNQERNQKFYVSSKWRKVRLYALSINPLCEDCKIEGRSVEATEIHHKHRLNDRWDLRLSMVDDLGEPQLISLCKMHHSRVTQREQRALKGEVVTSTYDRIKQLNEFK